MSPPRVTVAPADAASLSDLATLFGAERNTRRCWCTAFCSTRSDFAAGWLTGRNRRRFEALSSGGGAPMGVLASDPETGEPIGWCACGPRSRYVVAEAGRSGLVRGMDREEDDSVWLAPCFYVAPGHRGLGLTLELLRGAVVLARSHGATALEGWPSSGPDPGPGLGFVGREQVFEALGFDCVSRPASGRVVMRLELGPEPGP